MLIKEKPKPSQKNIMYGVDVQDKEQVRAKYNQLKIRHILITFFVVILFCGLGVIGLDCINVMKNHSKPIFAIKEKIANGYLYRGIGYTALFCDDDSVYIGASYKDCTGKSDDVVTFENMFNNAFMTYVKDNKIVNESNLEKIELSNIIFDEANSEGGSDYLVNVDITCKDGSSSCFNDIKETNDPNHVRLYVRFNRVNEVYSIVAYKDSGIYYDELCSIYTNKVKKYMIDNGLAVEDNIRSFDVVLDTNYGRFKYKDVMYSDAYKIQIVYLCKDNSNTCVTYVEEEEFSNLSFSMAMFLQDGEVALLAKSVVLDL